MHSMARSAGHDLIGESLTALGHLPGLSGFLIPSRRVQMHCSFRLTRRGNATGMLLVRVALFLTLSILSGVIRMRSKAVRSGLAVAAGGQCWLALLNYATSDLGFFCPGLG